MAQSVNVKLPEKTGTEKKPSGIRTNMFPLKIVLVIGLMLHIKKAKVTSTCMLTEPTISDARMKFVDCFLGLKKR